MIDFKSLSTLTITSLILAITFSIFAIAGIFYTLYKKGFLARSLTKVVCVFIFPFIALMMWTLAGLSVSNTFANNEALAIIISMIVSAVAIGILFFIAKSIESLKLKKYEIKENATKDELNEELVKVEKDLQNLKEIISDVIDDNQSEIDESKIEIKQDNSINEYVPENLEESINENNVDAQEKNESSDELVETLTVEANENVFTEEENSTFDSNETEEIDTKKTIEQDDVDDGLLETPIENSEVAKEEAENILTADVEMDNSENLGENEEVAEIEKKEEILESAELNETTLTSEKEDLDSKKEEDQDEKRESDFIKALNEILEQLEDSTNDDKN